MQLKTRQNGNCEKCKLRFHNTSFIFVSNQWLIFWWNIMNNKKVIIVLLIRCCIKSIVNLYLWNNYIRNNIKISRNSYDEISLVKNNFHETVSIDEQNAA
jgi:hypothetical protein